MKLITESGYNMFDMLSLLQKGIRRGMYDYTGFAASELKTKYRTAMWNRLLVISAEDCFGIITKEIVALRTKDSGEKSDENISNAIALLCKALKSRDACYFACNFILASRNPRDIIPETQDADIIHQSHECKTRYDTFGFEQTSLFGNDLEEKPCLNLKCNESCDLLQTAILHRDMDMIGYEMDVLRKYDREYLWDICINYASKYSKRNVQKEIVGLKEADDFVNGKKKEKDEIFISKAAMVLVYGDDIERFDDIRAVDFINFDTNIDWSKYTIKPIKECPFLREVPEWVYDCHTLKGKAMGKTDWDMTRTEQEALYPKRIGYFDEASWLYTYQQDFDNGDISKNGMIPILEFSKTHEANPVEFIPYL